MSPNGNMLFDIYDLLQIEDRRKLFYRSDTVNSKSFIGKVLLRIKWKFELTVHFKHEILGK